MRAVTMAAVAVTLFLAGCGSSGGDASSDKTTTTAGGVTTTTAAATTTATPTTAAPTTSSTAAPPATSTPILKETEIGPLRIGMSLDDAKATGWVGKDIGTCNEGLGGSPVAGSYGFGLDGASAPKGLDGSISFNDSKITTINVRGGARMANGVTIEPFGSWTPDLAIKALNQAGYTIAYETIFETNDLAKVTSPDGNHYQVSLTTAGVSVAVPQIEVCD